MTTLVSPGAVLPRHTPLPSDADQAFDRFAELVRMVIQVPVALVSFVDQQGQVFPGAAGVPEPWATTRSTPLSHSFCQYVVGSGAPLVVADAREDETFSDNAAVDDLGVIAYAGMPLVDDQGIVVGALCAIDHDPRVWSSHELQTLSGLAAACSAELQLRGALRRASLSEDRVRQVLEALPDAVVEVAADGAIEDANAQAVNLFGYPRSELVGLSIEALVPTSLDAVHRASRPIASATEHPERIGEGIVAVSKEGARIPVDVTMSAITRPSGRAVLVSIRDVTAAREAHATLHDSEQRFRVAFDSAPIGMALLNLTPGSIGRFLQVNQALCDLTAYSGNELLATRCADITHPDDRDRSITAMREMAEGQRMNYLTELRYLTKPGEVRWVALSVTAVRDTSQTPVYAISQIRDITDRKQAEGHARERFDELATNVDTAFALRSVEDPEFLYLNPAFFEVFGFDPHGPTPTTADLIARMHPDDRPSVEEVVAHLAAGHRHEREWRMVLDSGEQRWISSKISPIFNDDGVVCRFASLFDDVTDRRSSEAELKETQERFDQLARSSEVGFFLREGPRMLFMNGAFLRIFGGDPTLSGADVPGLLTMFHPDDLAKAQRTAAAADRGESNDAELRMISADGSIRWVHITNDLVHDENGQVIRIAGTVEDITARKAAESETVAARDEARRANAAKDQFLSRMSHELRTPLNAVLGFAQLMQLDDLPTAHETAIGHILRGGSHLLAMIDDILDITSIDSDRFELNIEPVHAASLVADAVALMQPLADTTAILLYSGNQALAATRYIRADARRLNQALLNLISNAVKYNRPGGTVTVTVTHAGDAALAIVIRDTGKGIAEADLPRLFNPFDRLGQESSQIEGTGIGLALTRRLIEAMDGDLSVTSTPGHGSTFTVTLPVTDPPVVLTRLGDAVSDTGSQVDTDHNVLLYIEDNHSNAELLTGILQRRPHWSMLHAADGASGLAIATTAEPTLILLDLHLPDIDGLDVLAALKASAATADIPVAILTADANPTQVSRLLDAGADIYLTKPLKIKEILSFLDNRTPTPRK